MSLPVSIRLALLCLFLGVSAAVSSPLLPGDHLRIGVTLHPYYAWLSNIVTEETQVVPILSEASDPHGYQARPEDVEKLTTLDALVINGLGHDAFIFPMLQTLGDKAPELIKPNAGIPLVDGGRTDSQAATPNSHTFLSITGATHQVSNLAAALQRLDPSHADQYRQNTREYKRRLRRLLADALDELKQMRVDHLRIGTVHDGYSYLFQELGLTVHAVVQPRHGINPSPRQLTDSIRRIKEAGINLLFVEMDYEQRFVDIVREETGTRIAQLSHISRGPYSADQYERQMAANLRHILDAVRAVQ